MKLYHWVIASLLSNAISGSAAFVVYKSQGQNLFAGLLAGSILILLSFLFGYLFFGRIARFLQMMEIALLHLKEGEFSLRLPELGSTQLQPLANLFHEVAENLRVERGNLLQRELLLDRVFHTVSSALLLTDGRHKIILCNPAARHFLSSGKNIRGMALSELLPHLPAPLEESILKQEDVLFTLDGQDGEPETWHLSCEHFRLNGQEHCLYHFKQMTRTLSRAEIDTWKKVIRVLSHELNNSLAPITSLAHSGQLVLERQQLPEVDAKLLRQIFTTMAERATHLNEFLGAYAQFARLPKSHKVPIDWTAFLAGLQNLIPFHLHESLTMRRGFVDAGQMSQVLINLIKNAAEAGAAADTIELEISAKDDWDKITVSDRGSGMSEEQLQLALLPFYSTKRDGTGLGLALCREIIDAHDGRIKLSNRKDGGLRVTIWLPANEGIV